jgi:hypothetical protein
MVTSRQDTFLAACSISLCGYVSFYCKQHLHAVAVCIAAVLDVEISTAQFLPYQLPL